MCQPGPAFSLGLETYPDPCRAARMEKVSPVWSDLPPTAVGPQVLPFASLGLSVLGEPSTVEQS